MGYACAVIEAVMSLCSDCGSITHSVAPPQSITHSVAPTQLRELGCRDRRWAYEQCSLV